MELYTVRDSDTINQIATFLSHFETFTLFLCSFLILFICVSNNIKHRIFKKSHLWAKEGFCKQK